MNWVIFSKLAYRGIPKLSAAICKFQCSVPISKSNFSDKSNFKHSIVIVRVSVPEEQNEENMTIFVLLAIIIMCT
jgi:hypothetical protein